VGPGIAKRTAVPAVLASLVSVLLFVGAPTHAAVAPLQRPYLALGDSITFGYVGQPAPPPDGSNPFSDADNFAGYPTYVGMAHGLQTVNAACPGESSASMITLGAPDAGCASYRSAYPLHVDDAAITQLQFAESFLLSNPDTRLVTIAIGINDMLLAIARCGGPQHAACINHELPAVLSSVRSNVTTIIGAVRATGYRGTIVLVNYYALEYANSETTGIVRALDATIAQVGADEHLRVADSFDAFKRATAATDGDACASGLFGAGPSTLGPCDLHPDVAGQRLLASAVEAALRQ
jgi:lysophospholipase L1-like esterase